MTAGDGRQMESLEHIRETWTCHKSVQNTYNLQTTAELDAANSCLFEIRIASWLKQFS